MKHRTRIMVAVAAGVAIVFGLVVFAVVSWLPSGDFSAKPRRNPNLRAFCETEQPMRPSRLLTSSPNELALFWDTVASYSPVVVHRDAVTVLNALKAKVAHRSFDQTKALQAAGRIEVFATANCHRGGS